MRAKKRQFRPGGRLYRDPVVRAQLAREDADRERRLRELADRLAVGWERASSYHAPEVAR